MSFVTAEIDSKLGALSRDDADLADFGIVKVDDEGKIELYNKYEAELAGVTPAAAEGRNFFTEIAPCTNNKLFFGRFQNGVAAGELDAEFNYTFTYKLRPTNVGIHMKRDKATGSNWIFVKKK
ncbi:MAG: photoactive yellow protein [Erythrobacter sp.]|uniref:photoactive yellow protein n=1 Tax=Erythrobacter sp. TaxID=1042 RepID=UPI0025F4CF41|nr:photoactive yellow protein [Erythrobacter sp.]MCL9999189.1 photoactive yellow protein [Erythrobacter sp.]